MIKLKAIAIEVKEEILGKVKQGEKVPVLAEQYGVSEKTIYAWVRGRSTSAVSILEVNKLKKENKELKEIIGVLTHELSKVKKKTA